MELRTASFQTDGFLAPAPLLTPSECRFFANQLDSDRRPQPADWPKGRAVTDWPLFRLAAHPRLLELLTPVLGEHIVLWGCSVVRQLPGEVHPWHVDIESSAPDGRYVTAWIALENVRPGSGLQLAAGSHLSGETIQQVQREKGYGRGEAPSATVLDWARERSPDARLVEPELKNGDAILFDGHLWHCSHNHSRATRLALVFQYAAAGSPVRMPDPAQLEWPFRLVGGPRPPAILVQGSDRSDANRLVAPPIPPIGENMHMLSTCIRSLDLPLAEKPGGGWQPHHLFRGATRIIDEMSCHAAVLTPGHSPHAPHIHPQEELLIVLDGEAELLIADEPSYEGARVEQVGPGGFAYYPAGQHHTIRNSASSPVTYLMFKWNVDSAKSAPEPLGTSIFHFDGPKPQPGRGFVTNKIFEQPTSRLRKLHCHTTRLEPGGGYDEHVDAHDVAILMLSGRVETLGQEVRPHGVIYYAAGERHGMRNIGEDPAYYLVFEFHAPAIDLRRRLRRHARPFAKRVLKRTARALGVDLAGIRASVERRWVH